MSVKRKKNNSSYWLLF